MIWYSLQHYPFGFLLEKSELTLNFSAHVLVVWWVKRFYVFIFCHIYTFEATFDKLYKSDLVLSSFP